MWVLLVFSKISLRCHPFTEAQILVKLAHMLESATCASACKLTQPLDFFNIFQFCGIPMNMWPAAMIPYKLWSKRKFHTLCTVFYTLFLSIGRVTAVSHETVLLIGHWNRKFGCDCQGTHGMQWQISRLKSMLNELSRVSLWSYHTCM